MADLIQLRRDTAAAWTASNPVLASGEVGIELDTLKLKVGDGVTAWNSLGYYIDTIGITDNSTGPVLTLADALITAAVPILMADQEVQRPKLKDASETVYAHGSVSGAVAVDFENGNTQSMTITGATTLSFTNPPASGSAGWMTLVLTNAGGDVTFPASVDFGDAGAPTFQAAGVDVVTLFTIDGGTTYRATQGWTG